MLLVPRTKAHLARTLAAVRAATSRPALGLAVSHVTHLPVNVPSNATGLILTSAQAVPALAFIPPDIPTYCVGQTTARAAEKKGLLVLQTEPDAARLTAYLATLHPQRFFHAKAANAEPLNLPMHTVIPHTAYATRYITEIPRPTLAKLRKTPPTGVLLFSPASASAILRLFEHHQLALPKTAYCLSANVARAWGHKNTKIAACPTLEAMVSLLP